MQSSQHGDHNKAANVQNNYGTIILGDGTPKPVPAHLTHIPFLDDEDVIGRDMDLLTLRSILETTRKVALVKGVGGVGKTTLARLYVSRYHHTYKHVAWIEQSGNLVEVLAADPGLRRNLHLDLPADTPAEEVCRAIFERMRSLEGISLLVIDNADSAVEQPFFHAHLPQPPGWQVLLTSRIHLGDFKVVEVEVLQKEDARKVFEKYYGKSCPPADLDPLLEAVGWNTLAIECMAKTIRKHPVVRTPQALLQHLTAHRLDDPAFAVDISVAHARRHNGESPKPEEVRLYRYLDQTFSLGALSGEEKRWLGYFVALPPQAYSMDFLARLFQLEGEAAAAMSNVLERLSAASWLQCNEEGAYAIHRIVQVIGGYQLVLDNETLGDLVEGLCEALGFDATTKDVLARKEFVLPAESVLSFLDDDKEITVLLRNQVAALVEEFGEYEKAQNLLETALASYLKNFDDTHPDVASMQSNLASVYRNLGNYEKAIDLLEAALGNDLKNFDKTHPRVAKRQGNLGIMYREFGNYEKAINLLEASLDNNLKNFDDEHPNVAISKSNLAVAYQDLGNKEKARDLLEAALASDLPNFGETHPNVATSQSNLGNVYRDLGEYERAEDLLKAALDSALNNFSEVHPTTGQRYNNLGYLFLKMERNQEARSCFVKAVAIRRKVLGENHPHTQISLSGLAEAEVRLSKNQDETEMGS